MTNSKQTSDGRGDIGAAIDALIAARSGTQPDAGCSSCCPPAPIFRVNQLQITPPEFIEDSLRRFRASGLFDGFVALSAKEFRR